MEKIRVILVGIGGYGANFVDEMLNRPENEPAAELVATVAPHPQKSFFYQQLVDKGIPFYPSIEEYFEQMEKEHPGEKTVDLAVLSTPINFHKSGIVACVEHGVQVLCEKPVAATIDDVAEIIAARDANNGTVSIGYQWSHSDAMIAVKKDILAGKFGKPLHMKTMVLWPRDFNYYSRGSGWAGKLSKGGAWTLDSVASNATAHYLHNIFFVNGPSMDRAAEVKSMSFETYRANDIETYDTCFIRGELECGADFLFVVSHAIAPSENYGPVFEYEYENGTIYFFRDSDDTEYTRAVFKDGTTKEYGVPSGGITKKFQIACDIALGKAEVVCGPETAGVHTKCVNIISETAPVTPVFPDAITHREEDRVWVEGLADVLHKTYETWKLPSELGVDWAVEAHNVSLEGYNHFGLEMKED